jgi:LytS/YehU family sensor histidine kinase
MTLFATQWFAYDASRRGAEPFLYYVWWSGYIWALLTPAAIWFAWRYPLTRGQWQRSLPVHVAASIVLTVAQLSLEAYLGWLHHGDTLTAGEAFKHYFTQHTQISLISYWILVGAVMAYRAQQEVVANRLRSVQLQAQLTTARLEALRNQLNPHFLFNTLQAATTLVRDDPDRAEDMLSRLGDLLRATLRESQVHEIPLQEELGILEHYTAIQECRFEDRLRFILDVPLDARSCLVPPLLLQPLVENAVRYGVGAHRGSDIITVGAERRGGVLRIQVANGIGSLDPAARGEGGTGLGLRATRERLAQLYGTTASSLELMPLAPTGVCAVITIPVRSVGSIEEVEESECLSAS